MNGPALTRKTELQIRTAQRRDDPRAFALGAIGRLSAKRTGRASCDAWIGYALGQWRAFLREQSAS